jgi:peptidoglycan hydrolase-like protein with peptidoglycan-binding domain
MWTPVYGEISPGVRELQKTLAKLWYFTYRDTAIYGVKTQQALIEYQLSHKLISSNEDLWSGVFGPKTRLHLIEDLSQIYTEDSLLSQNLEEDFKVYIGQTDKIIPEDKVSLQDISISI